MGNDAKDALLHTIMYTLMHRYDPDELQIWLVDFKKGINFKIYAEYQLPSFRVLAIESERELGCSVLQALEAEQRRRADLFSKERVSTYAEYRGQGKNLPRIVLIMDEFHELFAGYNDKVCRDSSSYITQLAHKTTDLGIHMIMASQNYTSIRNLDSTVYTQFPVRIVLKCARSNADILLDNGTDLISQIPRHDTGMAIYNASAGENSSSTYFRIAAIDPRNYRDYLNRINQRYQNHHGWNEQSSIFVPNVSDHTFSIFNQFSGYKPEQCPVRGRLYLGAPAHLHENFTIDLARSEAPNLLMVGNNLDKADAMFTLALLSLCINYRVQHGCAPEKPIAYLLNCQPAADRMLTHLSNLARQSPLSRYICVVDKDSAAEVFQKLLDNRTSTSEDENYVLVFGYHQAIAANLQRCNIGGILESLLKNSQHKGIHLVMWHNNYQTLQEGGFSLTSFFGKKIAFDVEPDHNSGRVQHFLNENDIAQMHGRNAVYFCNHEKQWFVPYQISSTDWLNAVVGKLQ
jgi:hypothetical protein